MPITAAQTDDGRTKLTFKNNATSAVEVVPIPKAELVDMIRDLLADAERKVAILDVPAARVEVLATLDGIRIVTTVAGRVSASRFAMPWREAVALMLTE